MADLRKKILFALNCSQSSPETEHLCENPVGLSCGHCICKDCIDKRISYSTLKCKICGKTNNRDLNQVDESHAFKMLFEQNINELFNITLEKFQNTIKTCKDLVYNNKECVDTHIQFIKDTVLLRIESLKIELDKMYDAFSSELDEIGEKWKLKIDDNKFDQKLFESELNNLEESINERKNLNREDLYKYQKQIKQIQQVIKEYKDNSPLLEFKLSEDKITKKVIGELVFDTRDTDTHTAIVNRIKSNKYEQMDMQYQSEDSRVLSNSNLLLSNYNDSNLQLYGANMQPIRTITSINGTTYRIISITSDEYDNIYMCAYERNYVIKIDPDFNQLAIFGTGSVGSAQNQLNSPTGICYYNQSVYVCDYQNKRVQKLNSNLVFQSSFPLNYEPFYIKNIKNIAILRAENELSIYFYDLNTFVMLKKYDGHNGVIGASKNCFYEYYASNKTFYCYKSNGELTDQIQINELEIGSNYGSICVINGKLFLTDNSQKLLIVI